jgi:putative methionine-R-sulfoxide reductase with GAF domain
MISEKIKISQEWEQILLNFIDVLHINILMVDPHGTPVLVPNLKGYGFHGASQWGALQFLGKPEFLSKFQKEDYYLKSVDDFGLQTFAIPIAIPGMDAIGYLIVGPVVLHRQLEGSQYRTIAEKSGINLSGFEEYLHEVRVVSFNSLKSVLDLLFELSQYAFRQLIRSAFSNLLDLSLGLTQAECGSIMLLDKSTNELNIQVYKGVDLQKFQNIPVKLDEGIAGLAVQNKEPFIINGEHPNNRVRPFLKKPEIKCSVVLPIIKNNKEVLGVLNVSTQQKSSQLASDSQGMLKSLMEITCEAMHSFL